VKKCIRNFIALLQFVSIKERQTLVQGGTTFVRHGGATDRRAVPYMADLPHPSRRTATTDPAGAMGQEVHGHMNNPKTAMSVYLILLVGVPFCLRRSERYENSKLVTKPRDRMNIIKSMSITK
jgi:hypothetical protein